MSTPVLALYLAAALSILGAVQGSAHAEDCNYDPNRVEMYTPYFSGSKSLTPALSQIINLQIWETLRIPKADGKPKINCGALYWDEFGADAHDVDLVKANAPKSASLVLWGKISQLGDDILVQSTLSFLPTHDRRKVKPEIWRVTIGDQSLNYNLVNREYSFKPFVVRRDVVKLYNGMGNLRLCTDEHLPCSGPSIGRSEIHGVEQDGTFARVIVSDGSPGWLYLPQLSEDRSEVVSFVSGLVRLMRGDYRGATEMFQKIKESSANTSLQLDSLLLTSASLEMSGESGAKELDLAQEINPYYRPILELRIMNAISGAERSTDEGVRAQYLEKARDLIIKGYSLFDSSDTWFSSAALIAGLKPK